MNAGTLHITNGDSAVEVLTDAGIKGSFRPWRDLLHEGPVPADLSLTALNEVRADYIIRQGLGDDTTVRAAFAENSQVVSDCATFDRVVLWFEHDLYDQLQLLQLLDALGQRSDCRGKLFLVQADHYLGEASVDDINRFRSFETEVSPGQIHLARRAWHAFRQPSPEAWCELLHQNTADLPYLGFAIERMLEEFPDCRDGLTRTQRSAMLGVVDGIHQPGRLFAAYQKTEERRFLGDLSFYHVLCGLMQHQPALLQQTAGPALLHGSDPSQHLILTAAGEAILDGDDHANPYEQGQRWWLGGTELSADHRWYWNPATLQVTPQGCF